jgi:hypothetical protein
MAQPKPKPQFNWEQIDRLHAKLDKFCSGENDPGFTVEEYATRYGIGFNTARGRLDGMVASGVLVAGWREIKTDSGRRRVRVYSPTQEPQ